MASADQDGGAPRLATDGEPPRWLASPLTEPHQAPGTDRGRPPSWPSPPLTEPHRAAGQLGTRIHIVGMSSSGKTTLAARLAKAKGLTVVDLDALNWLPGWVGLNEADPPALERRFRAATSGERWVTAGSYSAIAQRAFWGRVETLIWLDLPVSLCMWRMLRRSWHRWRTGELLWGTNRERFWPQLLVWRQADSLLWWIVTQHRRRRRQTLEATANPRWAHIRFVRLLSSRDVEAFAQAVERLEDIE